MKLKYFDAHCHITHIGQTILGIGAITNAATFSDWPDIISVSKQGADIYGALGVHPWYLADCPTDWDRILEKHLIENPALMVGELGWTNTPPTQNPRFIISSVSLMLHPTCNVVLL